MDERTERGRWTRRLAPVEASDAMDSPLTPSVRSFVREWVAWHALGWAAMSAAALVISALVWMRFPLWTQDDAGLLMWSWNGLLIGLPAAGFGWAQGMALERVIGRRLRWGTLTAVGTMTAVALLLAGVGRGVGPDDELALIYVRTLGVFLLVATVQWLELRRHLHRAWLWLGSAFAAFAGVVAAVYLIETDSEVAGFAALGVLMVSAVALGTVPIVWALAWAPPQAAGRPLRLPTALQVALVGATIVSLVAAADRTIFAEGWQAEIYDGPAKGPAPIPGLTDVVAIDAGGGVTFAVTADGTLWGWGSGGVLGVARPDGCRLWGEGRTGCTASQPVAMPDLPAIMSASTSGYHALVLDATGRVWAWGRNQDAELGPSFAGTCEPSPNPAVACVRGPALVEGLQDVVDVAAGEGYSVARLKDGSLMWWGRVSTPTEPVDTAVCAASVPVPTRTPVHVPLTATVADIATDGRSAFVVVTADSSGDTLEFYSDPRTTFAAVTSDGVGLQLDTTSTCATRVTNTLVGVEPRTGDAATYLNSELPDPTNDRHWAADGWAQTNLHGVVVDAAGGVWTWGGNWHGQLGGQAPDRCVTRESEISSDTPCARRPIRVDMPPATEAAAGDLFSVALTEDGRVFTWGNAADGRLGR